MILRKFKWTSNKKSHVKCCSNATKRNYFWMQLWRVVEDGFILKTRSENLALIWRYRSLNSKHKLLQQEDQALPLLSVVVDQHKLAVKCFDALMHTPVLPSDDGGSSSTLRHLHCYGRMSIVALLQSYRVFCVCVILWGRKCCFVRTAVCDWRESFVTFLRTGFIPAKPLGSSVSTYSRRPIKSEPTMRLIWSGSCHEAPPEVIWTDIALWGPMLAKALGICW